MPDSTIPPHRPDRGGEVTLDEKALAKSLHAVVDAPLGWNPEAVMDDLTPVAIHGGTHGHIYSGSCAVCRVSDRPEALEAVARRLLTAYLATTAPHQEVERLREERDELLAMLCADAKPVDEVIAALKHRAAELAVISAAQEIDREGYVDSMQNVPSWQRLAEALAALSPKEQP